MTTRNEAWGTFNTEAWGDFYAIDQHSVAPETLPVPATVILPGMLKNMHRALFEVRPGTGDDARELQAQLDAAAKLPAGSKPVVHVPKGHYSLRHTVSIPAGCDVQLIGDGVGNGTELELCRRGRAGLAAARTQPRHHPRYADQRRQRGRRGWGSH